MVSKTIKYTDFMGVEREEEFLFNYTSTEIVALEWKTDGGIEEYLKRAVATMNKRELYETFKDLILMAYGERSLDGKYFKKSKEISDAFEATNAFDILFMELFQDAQKMADFFTACMPERVQEFNAKADAEAKAAVEAETIIPMG